MKRCQNFGGVFRTLEVHDETSSDPEDAGNAIVQNLGK